MSFIKKTWLARIGTGLNRFLQNGTDYVTLQSAPESVTQQGDALSADNMNNLEQRIADAFDALDDEILTDEPSTTDTTHALTNAVATQIHKQTNARLENLEQKAGDYVEVQYRGTNAVPTGKAKYGIVNTIVGKTRAWNQRFTNIYLLTSTEGGITYTRVTSPNYAWTISGTASGANTKSILDYRWLVPSHVYLLCNIYVVSGKLWLTSGNWSGQMTESAKIFTAPSSPTNIVYNHSADFSVASPVTVTPILRDLTLIFGAGNEPSTVAEALSQLPELAKYDAYNAGSLVSTEVSGVKSVGVNIWNEEWEVGGINSDGTDAETNTIRSKNLIPVIPSTIYYKCTDYNISTDGMRVAGYDIEENLIGLITGTYDDTFTTPSNCYFVKIATVALSYGTVYKHDIQICLNSYADKTTYHPYKTDTLSFPETVTLKSAGSVSDELDVETGEVKHQIGEYTITGNESFSSTTAGQYIYIDWASVAGAKLPSSNSDKANILCSFAVTMSYADANITGVKTVIALRDNGRLLVSSDLYDNWSNLVGQKIYFELATPDPSTFIDPTPYNFLEVEGGGTVETIQEQTPVIDNCLDVGYLAL